MEFYSCSRFPESIDADAVRNTLCPEKDLDCISDASLSRLFLGETTGFAPCTAEACIEILKYNHIEIKGKKNSGNRQKHGDWKASGHDASQRERHHYDLPYEDSRSRFEAISAGERISLSRQRVMRVP